MYDVSIIGAGVVGCAIARELSKYKLNICLIEKEEDVSMGASKANTGIVHGGYVGKYGTLKGELCIKGNRMYKRLEKELNFGYRQTGALVIGFDDEDEETIRKQYENGIKVGCDDLEIIYREKIRELEPYINNDVKVALYSKSAGVASPYELTIALAENSIQNGVELKLRTEVTGIKRQQDYFVIGTDHGEIRSRYIVNAAGLYSDKIANMVGIYDFEIQPRRGQYVLFGKNQAHLVNTVIFQTPTKMGKGILVTTTYHGNFMIGPDAEDTIDREDVGTDLKALEYVIKNARKSIPDFDLKKAITTFSGIRAVNSTGDFIIGKTEVEGFINAAGIDSPGLTSSPAIAEKIRDILQDEGLEMIKKEDYNPYRKPIFIKKDRDFDGKIDDDDPEKNIICRCEKVTEKEIIDALHRGIPITFIDGIKMRTRAGMGFCQGTFCRPRVAKIIAREMNIPEEEVTARPKSEEIPPKRVDIKVIKKLDV